MAIEDLKPYQFTKDKQPDPSKKRVPKYKTRLKKFIMDNINVVNEKMKQGNSKFWEIAFERGYGKEKENIEHSGNINTNINFRIIGVDNDRNTNTEENTNSSSTT